jgi:cytosine/adenosine deaminase-related metal-dependent hydrolase/ubiquinone/menaquinone biosynthesis C-methylase UbiE
MKGSPVIDVACEQVRCGFDRWAEVYDGQPNPLIALEERVLSHLLPPLRGRDVLDAGCGTGRWLDRVALSEPRSLTGVDVSVAMLDKARIKLGAKAMLHHTDCTHLPVNAASCDVLFCSFVLSYISDLKDFATECARVMRTAGVVLLSDMHPVTAAERGWKRSFRSDGASLRLTTHLQALPSIIDAFQASGFEVDNRLEPCFDAPEGRLFIAAGKLAEFKSLAGVPAIYAMVLRKSPHIPKSPHATVELRLDGGRYAVTSQSTKQSPIGIEGGRIALTSSAVGPVAQPAIDLSGYLLLPGLINAHDHLEFGLYPKLGRKADAAPYRNAEDWAKEIHITHAEQIALHRKVPLETRLWWGAIRNLLCGVTTVCHHNPLHPELLRPGYPVRVVSRFGWSHSLAFDDHLMEKFRHTSPDHPFVIHAGEGIDENSADDIPRLHSLGALDRRTVLVHGVALTTESAVSLRNCGASLVICPTSNRFLFHRTLAKQLIDSIDNLAIGSDSPLTADGDLLDEVRYSHNHIGIEANRIYEMVTTQPARILRLRDGEGSMRQGAIADIIAVGDLGLSPAATVAELTFEQVEMVMRGGHVQMASSSIYERLSPAVREGMQALEVEGHVRWIRAPLAELFAAAARVRRLDQLFVGEKRIRYVNSL